MNKKLMLSFAAAIALAALGAESGRDGFVALAEAVPDAILEIRYYSTYNFVGDCIVGTPSGSPYFPTRRLISSSSASLTPAPAMMSRASGSRTGASYLFRALRWYSWRSFVSAGSSWMRG